MAFPTFLVVVSVFVFLPTVVNSIGIQENGNFGLDPDQQVETSNHQQQREEHVIGGSEFETQTDVDVNGKFLQALRKAETDVRRRASTDPPTNNDSEIKALKEELTEQKQRHEDQLKSILEQIDALARQDVKTLKLIGSRGQTEGEVKMGTRAASEAEVVITSGGTHYVRWGRHSCPKSAYELYRGYTAGSHYSVTKGGVNTLCLHDDPQWGVLSDTSSTVNFIYGAEYYFSSAPFSTANNGGWGFHYQDVPCIVCHTPIRSNQIMIPGRRFCPEGWTLEYNGYIVSDSTGTYTRSDFICLDDGPEIMVSGQDAKYGLMLSNVRIACGAIPCPRYAAGRPLTCVVCTK